MAAGYKDQFVVDTTGLETAVVETPAVVAALDVEALADRLDAVAWGERDGSRADVPPPTSASAPPAGGDPLP